MSLALVVLEKIEWPGGTKCIINPTKAETRALAQAVGTLRVMRDLEGNWYIWDAEAYTHFFVQQELGLLGPGTDISIIEWLQDEISNEALSKVDYDLNRFYRYYHG